MLTVHYLPEPGKVYLCRSLVGNGLSTRVREEVTCSNCLAEMLAEDIGHDLKGLVHYRTAEDQLLCGLQPGGENRGTCQAQLVTCPRCSRRLEKSMPLSAESTNQDKWPVTTRHRERAWEVLSESLETTAAVREWIATGNMRGDYINWAPLKKLANQFAECLPKDDPPLKREVMDVSRIIEEISNSGSGGASAFQLNVWITGLCRALRIPTLKAVAESDPPER